MCVFFVGKQIITRLVVLHTFLFSPPPRGRGKLPELFYTNGGTPATEQKYNRKVCPPPLRRREPYIRSVGVKSPTERQQAYGLPLLVESKAFNKLIYKVSLKPFQRLAGSRDRVPCRGSGTKSLTSHNAQSRLLTKAGLFVYQTNSDILVFTEGIEITLGSV